MNPSPPEGPFPPWASVSGIGNRIEADAAEVSAAVEVAGAGNRLSFGEGVEVERYAPAGFGATVPDIGRRSDAAIQIEGDDNVVEIAAGARLAMTVVIRGSGNRIAIGQGAYLHGFANLITDGARLIVGPGTTMVQGSLQLHEPLTLSIGEDCMISSQVYVSVSDIHAIHDRRTGARINPGASVDIGDHVWLGLRTMVMKGARIGSGSITAAGAIVSGEVPANAIVAGAPARVLRQGVSWTRDMVDRVDPVGDVEARPAFWSRLAR